MKQEAILFTKENAAMIVEHLDDYRTVEDLLEDYNYMLEAHGTVVLGRDILDETFASVSYVITQSYFKANHPDIQLNDKTFTFTYEF